MSRFALMVMLLSTLLFGCGSLPIGTSSNSIHADSARVVARASLANWDNYPNAFVGIAISGGGSRSANFSAAVIEELEKHGFLDHVTAISSVSGGSLTAAYYALNRKSSSWNWPDVYEKLRTDWEWKFIGKLVPVYMLNLPLNLWNWLRISLTHLDRSDLMAEVFDETLFIEAKFGDLGDQGPKLLLNATPLHSENSVWYSNEMFTDLTSRLDTYPISHAVMASGAFPGAFHYVTLTNYASLDYEIVDIDLLIGKLKNDPELASFREQYHVRDLIEFYDRSSSDKSRSESVSLKRLAYEALGSFIGVLMMDKSVSAAETRLVVENRFGSSIRFKPVYTHLFDGGATDNWGMQNLMEAAGAFSRAKPNWAGCFIFLIDAHPDSYISSDANTSEPDTRKGIDFFIDSNALDASDVLSNNERAKQLIELQKKDTGTGLYEKELDKDSKRSCHVWHITFDKLPRVSQDYYAYRYQILKGELAVPHAASRIKTRYKLTGIKDCLPADHQDILRATAWILINDDYWTLDKAALWFEHRGLKVDRSRPLSSPDFDKMRLRVMPVKFGKPKIYCE